jgi:phosphatidate cytidylyltransferase
MKSASSNPTKKASNLKLRIVSGVIGGALLLGSVWWRGESFVLLFSLIALLSAHELLKLAQTHIKHPAKNFGVLSAAVILLLHGLHLIGIWQTWAWLWAVVFLFFFLCIALLYDRHQGQPLEVMALHCAVWFYVLLPFMLYMRSAYLFGSSYQYYVALGFLLLLWANDTGAYFVGKALGKNKLFPRISPGKTWEGAIGGAVLSMFVALWLSSVFKSLIVEQWVGMSFLITLGGIYGDLTESMIKRSLGVKDSGTLIPGHGGLLDRFDGLLLAAPLVAAWLFWTTRVST